MNLYHLRYFVTLARFEHYTKAAEELMITQPSLSHAIGKLENELGVSLFEKEGRNIVLTKYGKLFLADVEKALETIDSAVNTLKMTSTGAGIIDLGFLRTLGTDFLPGMIRKFLQTQNNKGIDFHFHTGVTGALIQGLKEKKYDIVFCSKIEQEHSVEFTPIAKQELVLIVPKDHPLAKKKAVDLEETLPYPQILFSNTSGLRPVVEGLFQRIGERPQVIYEVEEDQVIAGLVAQNFGIAVVPNMIILNHIDVKVLRIKSPNWERNFYLAVMRDKYLAPVVQEFKNFVIDNAQL